MAMTSSPTIKAIFFLLVIALVVVCSYPCKTNAANSGSNETDREALVAFRTGISSDPFGFLNSWNESIHFCRWHGVRCNGRRERVVALDIQGQKLTGSFSPYIGNMSFLRNLSLADNSFSHQIPAQLGRLHRLKILHLLNNSFSGDIPANLSACTSLERLDVSQNNLGGKIPVELGSLSKLNALGFATNYLTGSIPLSFGNLSSLVLLYASENRLGGSIPSVLGKLKNLQVLALDSNNLSGVIPSQIYNLSSLTAFSLAINQIHGSLPPDMGITLPNLKFLTIAINHFVGPIPITIANLSNLEALNAFDNQLTGRVPTFSKIRHLRILNLGRNRLGSRQENDLSFISSLGNATDLTLLGLHGNEFGGTLPESLGNLSTKLSALDLGANYISGNLPTGIGNLAYLERLTLFQNHFTGNIPPGIWKIQNLRMLDLSFNKFSGKLSSAVGNLSLALQLRLDSNDLHGAIPSSVGNCKNLMVLGLSNNKFTGTIPNEVFDLSSLSGWLDLSNNRLSGYLPEGIGNLKNLGELDVFGNMLSGEIPSSLGSCTSMETLYMDANHFQGTIPSSLSNLRGIQVLNLSSNNLSGEIPKFLEGLDLRSLNLSFNNFEGAVPSEGIFKNSSAFSVKGNSRLCGGIPELKLPLCLAKRPHEKRRPSPTLRRIIIPTALGLFGLTSALGVSLCCWLRKKRKEPQTSTHVYSSITRISFQSLVNATNGFSSTNLIGIGSFGSVYRGTLEEDGKLIAVKVLNLSQRGALKSFTAECEALRNIRHRNLVSVVSCCSGIDYHGNDFKAVVYELMVNGSLEEWLHSVQLADGTEPRKNLSLVQRVNIAIDVASAVDYLHHHCQSQVVHCDIKPSNILLDDEMVAHLGDFGLARLVQQETNSSLGAADQSSSIGIKGTVGFAPPEYGMGSEASVCGDVYSYGILLLEMFTGKRPTDDIFHESMNLHNFVKSAFSEGLVGIVDPLLLQSGSEDRETTTTMSTSYGTSSSNGGSMITTKVEEECLISILKIGVACSVGSPGERMDMSSVAAQLRTIRNSLLMAGNERSRTVFLS